MKDRRFIICALIIISLPTFSNPRIPRYLNELYFGSDGWILEFCPNAFPVRLDTCLLATQSDTARFIINTEITYGSYTTVTPDSLDHALLINRSGDFLILYDSHYNTLDQWNFTSIPKECSLNWMTFLHEFYAGLYLDRTPTLGSANDTSGAMGWVRGTVSGENCVPLEDVQISAWEYFLWGTNTVYTDSVGQFQFWTVATNIPFWFKKVGYQDIMKEVIVYPENTVVLNMVLQKNPEEVEDKETQFADRFLLSENYPNPFNSITHFQYSSPFDGFVDIAVFDIWGRRMETLFQGFQREGEYRLFWDAFEAPSGIYFCRVQSGRTVLVKKWVLIR
jgi:hypothetical protein